MWCTLHGRQVLLRSCIGFRISLLRRHGIAGVRSQALYFWQPAIHVIIYVCTRLTPLRYGSIGTSGSRADCDRSTSHRFVRRHEPRKRRHALSFTGDPSAKEKFNKSVRGNTGNFIGFPTISFLSGISLVTWSRHHFKLTPILVRDSEVLYSYSTAPQNRISTIERPVGA